MSGKEDSNSTREQLASVEELDHVMCVVPARTWLALLTVGLLLAAAVAWGFLGEALTRASGQGILIKRGVLFNLVAVSPGQILDMGVEEGQFVTRGTVVATLAQPVIEAELREAQSLLGMLNEEKSFLESFEQKNVRLSSTYIDKQRATLEESIRLGSQRIEELSDLVASYEKLITHGVATKLELEKQKADLRQAQIRLLHDRQELAGLEVSRHQMDSETEQQRLKLMERIGPVEERIASLQQRLKQFSVVNSLCSGVVVEIHKNIGDMVKEGDSVATIELSPREQANDDMEDIPVVVAYIPPFQGQELRPGMSAQVAPDTVREDEYGVILGQVQSVSRYPASPKGMMRVLNNSELVHELTQEGAPVMVVISLQESRNTLSGYRWSSGVGPPLRIKSGSQCVVRIIARNQPPVELIIPGLKKGLFGSDVPTHIRH